MMTSLSFSRSVCCSASRRTHTHASFVPSCFTNKGKTLNKLSPFSCCFLLLGAVTKLNGRVSAVKLGGRGFILHTISSWQLSIKGLELAVKATQWFLRMNPPPLPPGSKNKLTGNKIHMLKHFKLLPRLQEQHSRNEALDSVCFNLLQLLKHLLNKGAVFYR